ncbi:unannotated protein [freshwater metagenome]|uniref:Unannotated protein n=1 Tax=freshwater metagenome TaxID=449393 RepID=A0A6J6VR25_9ZZZZ
MSTVLYTFCMRSTTIRVDEVTHAELLDLASATGDSLIDTVRAAAQALRQQRFAQQVAHEMNSLRENPTAWNDYLGEAEATTVRDGVA